MEEKIILNKDQDFLFNLIDKGPYQNYCISGKPGTGKSVLIRHLTEHGAKKYVRCAPTGLAAMNVNGKTLHSVFWIPTSEGIITEDYNIFPTNPNVLNFIKHKVQHLIVDEMSMLRCDQFDYIDRLMRYAKGVPALPFGGAQVILIGDFHQLPPVTKHMEEIQLRQNGYKSPFCFDAKVFKGNFKSYQLHQVMRQKDDPEFLNILHAARTGEVMPPMVKMVNKQVGHPGDIRINLTARNWDAQQINTRELSKLDGPLVNYQAIEYGKWPDRPCEPVVTIKVGAQVMVKKNKADRIPGNGKDTDLVESKIVNGTMGIVTAILPATDSRRYVDNDGQDVNQKAMPERVIIDVEGIGEVTIYRQRWELKKKERDENGKWEEEVVAVYDQMPLMLAWAISMHKSQGQSFHKVHIDPRNVFAPGQMYVAMSRSRSLKGISLESKIMPSVFRTDPDVLRFYEALEETVEEEKQTKKKSGKKLKQAG